MLCHSISISPVNTNILTNKFFLIVLGYIVIVNISTKISLQFFTNYSNYLLIKIYVLNVNIESVSYFLSINEFRTIKFCLISILCFFRRYFPFKIILKRMKSILQILGSLIIIRFFFFF